jgi:hypothetical protein
MSLDTKVVTEKEQLAQHEENNRFNPLFLLLLLSFSSSFSFFCRGLNVLFGTMTTQTIRLLHTASSKSDLTNLVNTADAEISKMIVECSD